MLLTLVKTLPNTTFLSTEQCTAVLDIIDDKHFVEYYFTQCHFLYDTVI